MGVLAGCSHMPQVTWPWHHQPAPAPQEVHELAITPAAEGGATAAFPQYWKRNTLLVDLQAASGTGGIVLKPVQGATWPVRLAFRVMPGQVGLLQVHGAQRLSLPITTQGAKAIDLEIAPGVYTTRTDQLTVTWEPATPPSP
jgi:hypothetical protein